MIHVLVLIYAGEKGVAGIHDFESSLMPILADHGARVLSAFRPQGHEAEDCPDEIHLVEFPSQAVLEAYRADPRMAALADKRAAAISTAVFYTSAEMVSYQSPGG